MHDARDHMARAVRDLARALLDRRASPAHWEGHLSSSALSTGTAVLALRLSLDRGIAPGDRIVSAVTQGTAWLVRHQNDDGGWGDTVRSRTNISTTAIVWAALSKISAGEVDVDRAVKRAGAWLAAAAGSTAPQDLRAAILRRYGKDQTFSVPILTVLALAGKLGDDPVRAWRSVPQLPFELAAFPHQWFQHLRLPVVSYALPALVAIGQVRHALAPSRNPLLRGLRQLVAERTHRVLRAMQPASGGYLEATPLTSFVVMSLAGMGRTDSPVVEHGVRFLLDSRREDGSWPIDTNLATWVTTLSVGALATAGALPDADVPRIRQWLLDQQTTEEHPFTHAAPGAWAWTPLSGGVPDADDTAGALVALRLLEGASPRHVAAAAAGIRWLLGLQNRDGGVPTFCRGWGALPFDRSTPEITAHALRAWSAWYADVDTGLQHRIRDAAARAVRYLVESQRPDGSWVPLWFGNEHAPGEDNPTYGTARTLSALQAPLVRGMPGASACADKAAAWLLQIQNSDGGWGGAGQVASTVEETGVVLAALGQRAAESAVEHDAISRGARWLAAAIADGEPEAAPIGLYFARLWYYEALYPLIFGLTGLAAARETFEARV